MTPVSSVAVSALLPTIMHTAPRRYPTHHLGTNAAPVSSAPDLFGEKSWRRGVYAACVSRAKGMRKQQMKPATSPHLSDCLRTAAAAASAAAGGSAVVALPCQQRMFA